MEQEKITQKRESKYFQQLKFLVASYFLYKFSFMAASNGAVNRVERRARGVCEGCRRSVDSDYALVAHINHKRGINYNNPDYLQYYCLRCEAIHHLSHIHAPQAIGMDAYDNLTAAKGALARLTDEDYTYMVENYSSAMRAMGEMLDARI